MIVRVKAKGSNKFVGAKETKIETSVEIKPEELDIALGNIIYSVESAGYSINTHEIYCKAIGVLKTKKLKGTSYVSVLKSEYNGVSISIDIK